MYTIIDIETTGGNPQKERITEIAIVVFDGQRVVDQFSSLVNPEQPIPSFISNITGIDNQMVATAPRFFEIARRVVELTEGAIFVAHNASFDYGFVQEEFRRLGYTYQRPTLDTVRLARKLLPGHASYSLGKLCDDLGIRITDRHRALGDALATVEVFKLLFEVAGGNFDLGLAATRDKSLKLNPALDLQKIEQLPQAPGVYYLYDQQQTLIYIGKSNNLRQRVQQHLANIRSERARTLRDRVADVSYELTGSELVALLLESEEIKDHAPHFNRAQRRNSFAYGLHAHTDNRGYLCFEVRRNTKNSQPIVAFATQKEGKAALANWVRQHGLCQQLAGLYPGTGACFHHSIGQCQGACIGAESADSYNPRAQALVEQCSLGSTNVFLIGPGRHAEERSVVKIEQGVYRGFGFVDTDPAPSLELLHACIAHRRHNREVLQILRHAIDHKHYERLIRF